MSLLNKSDLTDANSSRGVINLQKDKDDIETMINVIQEFIDSSRDVLIGDSFNAIRNHMQEYINVLQTRLNVAESLYTAVIDANNKMIEYMGDETTLNTADLESLKTQLTSAENDYNIVNAQIADYDPNRYWDSLSTLKATRGSLEVKINQLKKLIDLLEKLDSTDSSVYSTLMERETELGSYKTVVDNIKTINI